MSLVSATRKNHMVGICDQCRRPTRIPDDTDAETRTAACPECDGPITVERLYGTTWTAECNSLCMGAVGRNCSCSCGGENHAAAYIPTAHEDMLASSLAAYRARKQRQEDARLKRQEAAEREARRCFDEWVAETDGAREAVDALCDRSRLPDVDFLESMADRIDEGKSLSPRQLEVTLKILRERREQAKRRAAREAREQAALAAGITVPTGNGIRIVGTVRHTWHQQAFNPWEKGADKMVVETDDGWKVVATIPSGLKEQLGRLSDPWDLRGHRITVTATVEATADRLEGRAKRPRKAQVLDVEDTSEGW